MKSNIEKSMTFAEYVDLIDRLLAEGKTTGPKQSPAMFNYGKINRQRMRRVSKTLVLSNTLIDRLQKISRKLIWLVITEGWCGDAAQNIPAIELMAAESENIETRYILRDENPELMDRFLTNGARSIPKLIVVDAESFEILGSWGARPAAAQRYHQAMKDAGTEKSLISENLQRWYNDDKGQSIQAEFETLLDEWGQAASIKYRDRFALV